MLKPLDDRSRCIPVVRSSRANGGGGSNDVILLQSDHFLS